MWKGSAVHHCFSTWATLSLIRFFSPSSVITYVVESWARLWAMDLAGKLLILCVTDFLQLTTYTNIVEEKDSGDWSRGCWSWLSLVVHSDMK
jgi:hypothetical protein